MRTSSGQQVACVARALTALGICLGAATAAQAQTPEKAVAEFCEHDGYGDRLRPAARHAMSELVSWEVEPAWDRIFLISGFEVKGAKAAGGEAAVRVRYGLVAEVTGRGVTARAAEDIVTVHLTQEKGRWVILGPPPAPRLFATAVDREAMAASLAPPTTEYTSNSKFVWQLLRSSGWPVTYTPTAKLLQTDEFKVVAEPRFGDLVAYVHEGVPYHTGIYRGEGQMVSATINGGLLRSDVSAFPGEVRYLRVQVEEAPPVSPSPAETPLSPPRALPSPAAKETVTAVASPVPAAAETAPAKPGPVSLPTAGATPAGTAR